MQTFDLHKRTGLYVTFYTLGDRRERGLALLRLKKLYRAAGFELEGPELPDYLPLMLEFASAAALAQGELVLREHRPALELIRISLAEQHSPYVHVFEAIGALAGGLSVSERLSLERLVAQGPPASASASSPLGQPARHPASPHRSLPQSRPAPARGDAELAVTTMSTADIFLWVVIPYVAITIFILGHVWRYRRDQFGWTTRSTQLLERRLLKWGSPLFHYGALAAIGGHVLGILIPQSATEAVGIDEHAYHLISAVAGTLAGAAALAGLAILALRRATVRRVALTTSYADLAVYVLLFVVIAVGTLDTLSHNLLASGNGYNYRHTVAIWFRGVFALQDNAQLMAGVPLIYQVHALTAWAILALWPFSRLVHAWSIPFQYIGRPYILYRRRYGLARVRGLGLPRPGAGTGGRAGRAAAALTSGRT